MTLVLVLMAGSLGAATLVLKGGKTLAVQGFSQQGNLLVVRLADGRLQSYPLTAVDMAATAAANPAAPAAEVEKAKGPTSPFAAAKATEGAGALVVTDRDVNHFFREGAEGDETGAGTGEKDQQAGGSARVVLLGYDKKVAGEGQWEVTTTLVNQGEAPASGVSVTVRAVDAEGKEVGSASGSASDQLAPGKQTTVVIKMAANVSAQEFRFDVGWQSIAPVGTPRVVEAGKGEESGKPAAPPAPTPTPRITRYLAPPNTILAPVSAPGNPNMQVPLTAPPSPAPGK
jgi:hypothetical protein